MNGPSRSGAPGALPFDWQTAVDHLADVDPRLAALMDRLGRPRLELRPFATTFEALARSIVYQQLTGKAAGTIHGRLAALFPSGRVEPTSLLNLPDDALRAAGLSRGKVAAVRDLAARTLDGTVPPLEDLHAMTDDAIVERLVQVRGVGRWTVEMLLIFGLGRPDILPIHDYGVRHGVKLTYRKRLVPTPAALSRHGEKWRPFRTVASWYMWRALDLARMQKTAAATAAAAPRQTRGARARA